MHLTQQWEQDPSVVFETKDRAEQLRKCLDTLPERERLLIVRRFGLDGDDVNTLKQLGRVYGVTVVRIYQMQVRGLQRLRSCTTLASLVCLPDGKSLLSARLFEGVRNKRQGCCR